MCFSYQDLEQKIEQFDKYTDRIINSLEQIAFSISKDIKKLFCNQEESIIEYTGIVDSIQPLAPEIPEEYINKCYHSIRFVDGKEFQLIFDHLNFDKIQPRLKRGNMVKVTYNAPNRIVNLYPRPYYQIMAFDDFLDLVDIENDQAVKVCYFDGHLQKIELIWDEEQHVTD